MGKISLVICPAFDQAMRMLQGVKFMLVDMLLSLRKIGQTAGMVKMEMGEHNMLHLLRFVPSRCYLAAKRHLRVVYNAKILGIEFHHPLWVFEVMQTQTAVDQYQTLVGLQ